MVDTQAQKDRNAQQQLNYTKNLPPVNAQASSVQEKQASSSAQENALVEAVKLVAAANGQPPTSATQVTSAAHERQQLKEEGEQVTLAKENTLVTQALVSEAERALEVDVKENIPVLDDILVTHEQEQEQLSATTQTPPAPPPVAAAPQATHAAAIQALVVAVEANRQPQDAPAADAPPPDEHVNQHKDAPADAPAAAPPDAPPAPAAAPPDEHANQHKDGTKQECKSIYMEMSDKESSNINTFVKKLNEKHTNTFHELDIVRQFLECRDTQTQKQPLRFNLCTRKFEGVLNQKYTYTYGNEKKFDVVQSSRGGRKTKTSGGGEKEDFEIFVNSQIKYDVNKVIFDPEDANSYFAWRLHTYMMSKQPPLPGSPQVTEPVQGPGSHVVVQQEEVVPQEVVSNKQTGGTNKQQINYNLHLVIYIQKLIKLFTYRYLLKLNNKITVKDYVMEMFINMIVFELMRMNDVSIVAYMLDQLTILSGVVLYLRVCEKEKWEIDLNVVSCIVLSPIYILFNE
jgi:hypothetical protein